MKCTRQVALVCLCLSLLIPLIGCGAQSSTPGKLTGKVTLDNSPVTGGELWVHAEKGGAVHAIINTDGTYTATDLPAGEWKVTFSTDTLNPNLKKKEVKGKYTKAGAQSPTPGSAKQQNFNEGQYVPIPERYTDLKKTPVTVTVIAGTKTHNFELTSK